MRTIAQEFEDYFGHVMPPSGVDVETLHFIRATFYAGAVSVVRQMAFAARDDRVAEQFHKLHKECTEFSQTDTTKPLS